MNRFLLILLMAAAANAQDVYSFDVCMEYEIIVHDKPNANRLEKYYVNSADNLYHIVHYASETMQYNLYFVHYDKRWSRGKKGYRSDGTLIFNETFVAGNPYKYQRNNYAFSPIGDTVLNGRALKYVRFFSTKPKRIKKKKLYSAIMFFEPGPALPLLWHPTAMEIWLTRGGIPNGTLVEQHMYDENNVHRSTRKLLAKTPNKMRVQIPKPNYKVIQGAVVSPYSGTRYYQPGSTALPFNIHTPQ